MENKTVKAIKKIKSHYRDEDAQDNQEVVTPPELVAKIYEYLSTEELQGDILDPCVGPGALVQPLLDGDYEFKSLTMLDIQDLHIQALKDKYDTEEFDQEPEWNEW